MKHEKTVTLLVGLVLAWLLSFGAMGAMITGLGLPVENLAGLYWSFFLCALAGCILFSFRKGWVAVLVLVASALIWLWLDSGFVLPARALISRLTFMYDSAYGWGVVEFSGVNWQELALDVPLGVWGCFIALAAAAAVVWGRGTILTVIAVMAPLSSTVVVTNTPPAWQHLFAVMLGLILLLLTATVRRHDPRQGAKLVVLTALPVTVLLGALFAACPQESYVNRSEEYLDSVVSWLQSGFRISDSGGLVDRVTIGPNAGATANLSRVGPRNTWAYKVMEVEADFSDTIYLRGQDYDSYDGGSWTAATDREEVFGGTQSYGYWVYEGEVKVRTPNTSNVLYLPYYPTQEQILSGGQFENKEGLREYSFGVRHPQSTSQVRFDSPVLSLGDDASRYTQLPSDTRRWAEAYLEEYFDTFLLYAVDDSQAADAIADHVRGSAVYDTNTPRMSGDYDDFVQWFLEESDRGYCVHFASATAVLLRAAGVPARYVTGYMLTTEKDRTVEVTADQAHAWVEYYDQTLGAWIVLESTPADLREEEDTQPVTQPPETERTTEAPTEEAETPTRSDGTPAPTEPEGPRIDLTPLFGAAKWLLLPAGLWAMAEGQYLLRRKLRRYRRKPNRRALDKWRDVEILCRVNRQEPPAELEELAQKAKFSQHTLTPDELGCFDAWLRAARGEMKRRPWYIRLLCRYVLAVW